jgi:hypothetical protein
VGESVLGEVRVTQDSNQCAVAIDDRDASDIGRAEHNIRFSQGRIDLDDDRVDRHDVCDQ